MTKYRIAMGFNTAVWTKNHTDYLVSLMTKEEGESFVLARATAIFYSLDPIAFMRYFYEDDFKLEFFSWINISKE